MGFSTGAYLSFAVAASNPHVSAFVGRALITSFEDVLPILKKIKPDRDLKAPADYPQELLPINAAENMNVPVMLIVGEKDDRTPVWMSQKIYSKLKCPKQLWVVPGAEHGGGNGPDYLNYPEFFIRIVIFLNENLK